MAALKRPETGPWVGTTWSNPAEDLVTILLTQAAWTSPVPPAIAVAFQAAAYAAVDD